MAVPAAFDAASMINRLLSVGMAGGRLTTQVSEAELLQLCQLTKEVFISQSSLIEIDPPVIVCGDIHGQYADLLRVYDRNGFPPESNYIFLGDYVDRGRQNIETICLMFSYKVKYPENFFMLRGNHECPAINRVYGFFEECQRRYRSVRLWNAFQDAFNWMPLCGLIGGKILCMHGGLSPQLKELDQLRSLPRPQDPPNPSMGIDLLWADPDQWVKGWQGNSRGVSFTFGQDVVVDACNKLDIDLVARAHQVVQDGYEFFANRRLVTIFSAPHYCGQFDNAAATMSVADDLSCSFSVYRPTAKTVRLNAKSIVTYKPLMAPGPEKSEEKSGGAISNMFKSIVGKNKPHCKIEPTPLVSLPTPAPLPPPPPSTPTSPGNQPLPVSTPPGVSPGAGGGTNQRSVMGTVSMSQAPGAHPPIAHSPNRNAVTPPAGGARPPPPRMNSCYLPVNPGYTPTPGSPRKAVSEPMAPTGPARNANNNSVYLAPK